MPLQSVEELEDRLSRPSAALTRDLAALDGDILVLGAGGKLGPSLVRLALRAVEGRRSVIAVSRFGDRAQADALAGAGARVICADISDDAALAALPDAANNNNHNNTKNNTTNHETKTWYT